MITVLQVRYYTAISAAATAYLRMELFLWDLLQSTALALDEAFDKALEMRLW